MNRCTNCEMKYDSDYDRHNCDNTLDCENCGETLAYWDDAEQLAYTTRTCDTAIIQDTETDIWYCSEKCIKGL